LVHETLIQDLRNFNTSNFQNGSATIKENPSKFVIMRFNHSLKLWFWVETIYLKFFWLKKPKVNKDKSSTTNNQTWQPYVKWWSTFIDSVKICFQMYPARSVALIRWFIISSLLEKSSDMLHNFNAQFKYATVVYLTLIKISLLLLTISKSHVYNIIKMMTN
jgi:hypothetical protein